MQTSHPSDHPSACVRPDLASDLVHWEELDFRRKIELERHSQECGSCGPALALLRRADAWMRGQTRTEHLTLVAGTCPPPEELYEFGRGPGAVELPLERRRAVEAHLIACASCKELVTTLASRPPSPLDLSPLAVDTQPPALHRIEAPAGPWDLEVGERIIPARRWLWVPALAAAAALVFWLDLHKGFEPSFGAVDPRTGAFPAIDETLRGSDADGLLWPRDRLLADGAGKVWLAPTFEIEPQSDAEGYHVVIERHAGGAFERGTRVATFESLTPEIHLGPAESSVLTSGHYTWSAWAEIDGLAVPIGSRDFELVSDGPLAEALNALRQGQAADASEQVLARLHEQGLSSDARNFARDLPPSPARDEYMSRKPGR